MSDTVLAELRPSMPRRVLGLGMLVTLAAALVFLAFDAPDMNIAVRMILAAAGGGLVVLSAMGWQATGVSIQLTGTALRTSGGEEIARLERIAYVERGAFALKPSGGFVLVLKDEGPSRWAPGLWWRMGQRVGVGGLVPPAAARAMADMISERITPAA